MQGVIMGNFVQATKYEMYLHANFEYLHIHIYF
jgi:hypothetical protein